MNVVEIKRIVRSLRSKAGLLPPYRGYGPLPHAAKINALKRVFVPGIVIETGTCYGDTTVALVEAGYVVHTIEVSQELSAQVFPGLSRLGVRCYTGDSGHLIQQVIETTLTQSQNVNFWLDGHWSGGATSRAADYETPILQELSAISKARARWNKLVVAVDDVRCFGNDPAYPPKQFLADWANANRLNAYFLADIFVASTETYSDL